MKNRIIAFVFGFALLTGSKSYACPQFTADQIMEKIPTLTTFLKNKLEASEILLRNNVTVIEMGRPKLTRSIPNYGEISTGIIIENITLSNGVKIKVNAGYYEASNDQAPFLEFSQPRVIGTEYDDFGNVTKPGHCASRTAWVSGEIDVENQDTHRYLFSIKTNKQEIKEFNIDDLTP